MNLDAVLENTIFGILSRLLGLVCRKLAGGRVGMRRLKVLEVGGSSAAQSLCKTAAAAVEWRRARQRRAPQAPVKFSTPGAAVRVAKVRRR